MRPKYSALENQGVCANDDAVVWSIACRGVLPRRRARATAASWATSRCPRGSACGGRTARNSRRSWRCGRGDVAQIPQAPVVYKKNATRCDLRSEEHTSELQSLMRISYADFCLKKKTRPQTKLYT